MLTKLRNYFLKSDLKKAVAKNRRTKALVSVEQAKSIGVLYMVGDEKDYIAATNLFGGLQQMKKEVRTLGFIDLKDLPHYCYPRLSFDYISQPTMNWYKRPFGDKIKDFIHKDFDILLNLDTTQNPSLTYVYAISNAKFKIGIDTLVNKEYSDLMISTKNTVSLPDLFEYMMSYIKMFAENK